MSNPLGYSYPAGAEHDPRAPYNQHEPDDCPACEGTGRQLPTANDDDSCEACPSCDGTGQLYPPSREERAIEKADRDMDASKDEPDHDQ